MTSTTAGISSYITIDTSGSNRNLNILTTDATLNSGTPVIITITSTLSGTQALFVSLTTAITFTDPCRTTTITTKSITAMSVTIGGAAATRDFTEVTDSKATLYGIPYLCG